MEVLNLLISEVKDTLKRQDITLKVGVAVKKYLLSKGYSDEYGARSLRRTVEKELLDKIAEILLKTQTRPLSLRAEVGKKGLIVGVYKVNRKTR